MQADRPADTPVGRPIPGCLCLNTVSVCQGGNGVSVRFPIAEAGLRKTWVEGGPIRK